MDLNFHQLTLNQILKIQKISKYIFQEGITSFNDVREKTNVIIEREIDGHRPEYEKIINAKTADIFNRIMGEKDRRQNIAAPLQLNLNPEQEIPINDEDYEYWPGEDGANNNPVENGNHNHIEDIIEEWPADIERDIRDENENADRYRTLIDKYSDALIESGFPDDNNDDFIIGTESYSALSNTDLRALTLKLFRYKYKRVQARYSQNAALGATTLGMHFRYGDKKKNDIFLFIDNIESIAKNATNYSTEDLLEITYIHELFHAFYAFNSGNDFIFLDSFHEVEEAMAEMGTLWFASIYDGGRLFNIANEIIFDKWNCGIRDLKCYGLGYHLYNYFCNRKRDIPDILNNYQLVQRLFRIGNPKVKSFVGNLYTGNHEVCATTLLCIIRRLMEIKRDEKKHFYFDNGRYGYNSDLVYRVLQYIKTHGGRVPMRIRLNNGFQNVIRDKTLIVNPREKKKYHRDRTITISVGREYSLWEIWNDGLDGNTIKFIDKIVEYHRLGLIPERITII